MTHSTYPTHPEFETAVTEVKGDSFTILRHVIQQEIDELSEVPLPKKRETVQQLSRRLKKDLTQLKVTISDHLEWGYRVMNLTHHQHVELSRLGWDVWASPTVSTAIVSYHAIWSKAHEQAPPPAKATYNPYLDF